MPVWQLLGGKVRDRIKVYGWIGGDDFKNLVDAAVNRRNQGFTAVKMNATGQFIFCTFIAFIINTTDRICGVD